MDYDKLDGKLPGCNEFAGFVTFNIHVDQPNFTVEKQVSKAGENKYSEQVTALPGEEVEYKIQYKNTGTTQQNDVVIKDKLPAGVSYVNGTTQFSNSKTNSQWKATDDNNVVGRGINLGAYAPNGNVYVKFKAKVTDNDKLEKCGVNTLVNTATAETNNGSKSDTANVVVSKKCEETPPKECKPGIPMGDKRCEEQPKPEECKPGIPMGDTRCEEAPTPVEKCTVPGKENLPKDSNQCKEEAKAAPAELPHTGAGDGIAVMVGLSSFVAALGYYVTSRRNIA